ncbi:MAG: glycine betaine ABC transporter substrate-binding protein [Solirubrobacteraceae bacterium]
MPRRDTPPGFSIALAAVPIFLPRLVRLPVAILLVAIACAACGSSRGSGTSSAARPATTSSTSSTSSTTTSTGTGTGATTQSTTSTAPLPGAGHPQIIVGDKNYSQQFILGQLYVQALSAEGFSVNLDQNIGPIDVTLQALKSGALSMYPEYLNVFNGSVAGYTHGFRTQLGAFIAAQRYAVSHGLQLLAPTPFSDTSALAVTDAYAAANHLRTISDLGRVSSTLTLGGPPQFAQSTPGLPSLGTVYGVVPATFKPMAIGDQYPALNNGSVQAADVNTTDGELATGDYQLLRDPRRMFGYGNVVPVVSAHTLAAEGPAFSETIQRVDDTLTTTVMRQLDEAVDLGQDPAAVAKQFLQTHGLLTPAPF